MENLSFGKEELTVIQREYPEVWYRINLIRVEKAVKAQSDMIEELRGKLHALGPQPAEVTE